jgi:ABC-2 type transport system permease protein
MTFTMNPVLDRELRERVRGKRSVVLLTVFLFLLSALAFLVAWGMSQVNNNGFGDVTTTARIGRSMFEALVVAMLFLVVFITPGLTGAAIAAERDRQTLVPMLVTLLGPRSILVGKLLAALAFLTLMIVAAMPLLGVSVVFGGVTVWSVIKTIVALNVCALLVGSVSILCSTLFRRVQTATLAAYFCMLAIMVGPLVGFGVWSIANAQADRNGPRIEEVGTRFFVLHPLVGTADFLRDGHSLDDPNSSALRALQLFVNPSRDDGSRKSRHGAFWVWWLGSTAIVSTACLGLASRRLRAPSHKTLDR